MIIFVYGENSFLSQKKVTILRDQFKAKFDLSGMNLVEFPANDSGAIELGDVFQAVQTPPFISEKRMVVVKGLTAGLKKADAKPWIEALNRTPASTILIFWDQESEKKIEKSELFSALQNQADVYTYPHPLLSGSSLFEWAREYAKTRKINIDTAKLQKVIALVGSDLWQLSGELEKLTAYSLGKEISDEMIGELVKANFADQIFAFIDAVSNKEAARALRLLEEQRLSGSSDFQLFSMLARQVRILLGVRSIIDDNERVSKYEVAEKMKLHPFVAEKSLSQARKMSFGHLETLHSMIVSFDAKMKLSGITPDLAVDRLVVEMIQA
ncbi:DNA polymerase III subunit delta [Patescibacteria group bacterium]|nr:DNA polymerase III subunit delta [Patescibacteria group bacterium]